MADDEMWLIAVISLNEHEPVQCQCKNCGHRIYAAVHMVGGPGDDIQCWGSECFKREFAGTPRMKCAEFPEINGRRLTEEERRQLTANREALIASFRAARAVCAAVVAQASPALAVAISTASKPTALMPPAVGIATYHNRKPPQLTSTAEERLATFARELVAWKQGRREFPPT